MADPGTDRKAAFARMTRAENLYWHCCTAPMQEGVNSGQPCASARLRAR
jgi:hypothetical protein